ncbi:MAG: hypothetical protein P9F19_01455 [Candidatus Contendobacter sp.]|nr:hypothetical protein [Candidatus Contendobacter sp.]MDG4556056.1 hypothetical protein [Candidatus Contendobacter sp.]
MNLESLKDKLGDEYAALERYVTDLIGQRDAARKESQEGRKALKAKVEALESVRARLFERLGLDDDADLDALPDAKGQAEAVKQFETRVKRLETELKAKSDAFAALDAKHRAARLEAELGKALGGHDFIDREVVEDYLRRRVDWQDDQMLYKSEKGDLIPLAEGVTLLAQTKPHLLKTPGARGSGYNPSAQGGAAKHPKNPWAKDSFNLTEQLRLAHENPTLAAQLQAAAGA